MAEAGGAAAEARPAHHHEPQEQYQDLSTQAHAAQLGMWIFLSGEVLLFSAMFTLYAGYRGRYPQEFAEAAGQTVLWMGSTGTVVLLTGSFLVAWAVHAIRHDKALLASRLYLISAVLGGLFLSLKFWEYAKHAADGLLPGPYYHHPALSGPGYAAFFNLYYIMTGAHALHVIGGIVVLLTLSWKLRRGEYDSVYSVPVELGGMYWHLVDIVWLFLWPFFYLLRR